MNGRSHHVLGCVFVCVTLASAASNGQGDPALFTALRGFYAGESEVVEYDYYQFGYLPGAPRVEGRRTTFGYWLLPGNALPGALGVCRAIVAENNQTGTEVLYDNHRNIAVLKRTQGGVETWGEFSYDKDRYRVNMIERPIAEKGTAPNQSSPQQPNELNAKVRDQVKANADKAFDELAAEEAKHKLVAANAGSATGHGTRNGPDPFGSAQPAAAASVSDIMKTKHDTAKNSISSARTPEADPTVTQGSSETATAPAVSVNAKLAAAGSSQDALPAGNVFAFVAEGQSADTSLMYRRGYTKGCSAASDPSRRYCPPAATIDLAAAAICADAPVIHKLIGHTKNQNMSKVLAAPGGTATSPPDDVVAGGTAGTGARLTLVDQNIWSCHLNDGTPAQGTLYTGPR